MTAERFVVLGLAQARSAWFRDVSHWATSASLPVEFLKAMSIDEVRVRLQSGRPYSAVLLDDSLPGLDRDLVDLALHSGCSVVLVSSGRVATSRADLGASAHLPLGFGRDDLAQVLAQVAAPVAATEVAATDVVREAAVPHGYRGRLIAVTGAGGTGRSTVAMALAQGLAADPRHADLVCLADLALHADLAMLHDARDVVPGIIELVEAHRAGTPSIDAVRALTWRVDARGYHLLLGLRRHRDWTSLRPRAFDAALDSLRRGFRLVVADVDDDVEGERATGSVDVQDRNAMARIVSEAADVIVVVGAPGLHGLHALLRVSRDLLEHGVSGRRILPVVNRSHRSPRLRAEVARAYGELLVAGAGSDHGVPAPIHLGVRRNVETVVRDGGRFPDPWLAAVCGPVLALLDAEDDARHPADPRSPEPVAIVPGSLGSWAVQDGSDDLAGAD